MADEIDIEAQRDALCDAAVAYAAAGWSILPTRPSAFHDPVCHRSPASPQVAHCWWSETLYGIACPVGEDFDVIEVPASLGHGMLLRLSQCRAPVLRLRNEQGQEMWRFLVTPGSPRIADLPRG